MNWFESFWSRLKRASTPQEVSSLAIERNFTPRAQQVLALARQEANRFNHSYVGTEHLLLALIRLDQGVGITALKRQGFDLELVQKEIEKLAGSKQDQTATGTMPYTPRVKKVLALAATEACTLQHSYVGTEHMLLGLLLEEDGVAARVLKTCGVAVDKTRAAILQELDPNAPAPLTGAVPSGDPRKIVLHSARFGAIDTTKRYDVYCSEGHQKTVVYRNALFKGRRKLLSALETDPLAGFLELELANGQTVYLSMHSVDKFCEPGMDISGETIPPG